MDQSQDAPDLTAKPHVYILDDDSDARQGVLAVAQYLPVHLHEIGSIRELQQKSSLARPGCLILDHLLDNGRQGLSVLKMPQMGVPPIATVLFSGHADVSLTVQYMRRGVRSVIEKPMAPPLLIGSIEEAIEADRKAWTEYQTYLDLIQLHASLSPRKKSVLSHVLNGEVNKWIAKELLVSDRTVELDRAWLLKAFDAENFVVLAAKMERLKHLRLRFDPATSTPPPSASATRDEIESESVVRKRNERRARGDQSVDPPRDDPPSSS